MKLLITTVAILSVAITTAVSNGMFANETITVLTYDNECTIRTVPNLVINGVYVPHGVAEVRRKSDNKIMMRTIFQKGLKLEENYYNETGEIDYKAMEGLDYELHYYYKAKNGEWIRDDNYHYHGMNACDCVNKN